MEIRAREAYDEPMRATAVDGEVVILGPGSMSGSFTVDAALASIEAIKRAVEGLDQTSEAIVDLD